MLRYHVQCPETTEYLKARSHLSRTLTWFWRKNRIPQQNTRKRNKEIHNKKKFSQNPIAIKLGINNWSKYYQETQVRQTKNSGPCSALGTTPCSVSIRPSISTIQDNTRLEFNSSSYEFESFLAMLKWTVGHLHGVVPPRGTIGTSCLQIKGLFGKEKKKFRLFGSSGNRKENKSISTHCSNLDSNLNLSKNRPKPSSHSLPKSISNLSLTEIFHQIWCETKFLTKFSRLFCCNAIYPFAVD